MDVLPRSVTRAGPTFPRASAHFSGRKWKSRVASSSKPASVRRNDHCLNLACPLTPAERLDDAIPERGASADNPTTIRTQINRASRLGSTPTILATQEVKAPGE